MLAAYELVPDYHLLRTMEPDFNRNIYLRTYRKGNTVSNLIMDPGSRLDIDELLQMLQKLIGGVKNLNMIFISHQDPDLTGNIHALMQYSPAYLVCSEDTWRLMRTTGLDEKRFIATESMRNGKAMLRTGQVVEFIPAYYCHFRGASMLYDLESRILFSGDFLGGLLTRNGEGIFANSESWAGVEAFHQLYMPNSAAIGFTISRIRALSPSPMMIAPQHGDVISRDLINEFLIRLENTNVGIENVGINDIPHEIITRVFNRALGALRKADDEVFKEFVKHLRDGGNFTPIFEIHGTEMTQVKVNYLLATDAFMEAVAKLLPEQITEQIRLTLFNEFTDIGLVLPNSLAPKEAIVSEGQPFA
jgi:glyoxylase-like metal-dependent hydrolase (beta-lactamase superfamily II)